MQKHRNHKLPCAAALLLLLAGPAFADEGFLYVGASGGPAVLTVRDPEGSGVSATRPGESFGLSSWYGLSNTLHLGGSLRFSMLQGATVANTAGPSLGGSPLEGPLRFDASQWSLSTLGRYRFDTGARWAPYVVGELGLAVHRRTNMTITIAAGPAQTPSVTAASGEGRLEAGIEYRYQRFLFGLGVAVQASGHHSPVQFEVPLTIAWIPKF